MRALWRDLRQAARALRANPGLVALATLSLALGIGANVTVFAWARAVLLEPFPGVRDAGPAGEGAADGPPAGVRLVLVPRLPRPAGPGPIRLRARRPAPDGRHARRRRQERARLGADRLGELLRRARCRRGARAHAPAKRRSGARGPSGGRDRPRPLAAALWRRPRDRGPHGAAQHPALHRGRRDAGGFPRRRHRPRVRRLGADDDADAVRAGRQPPRGARQPLARRLRAARTRGEPGGCRGRVRRPVRAHRRAEPARDAGTGSGALPAVARAALRRRDTGADHHGARGHLHAGAAAGLREPGEPAAGARRESASGDRDPPFARGEARRHRAPAARREPAARAAGRRGRGRRRHVRDRPARGLGAADALPALDRGPDRRDGDRRRRRRGER